MADTQTRSTSPTRAQSHTPVKNIAAYQRPILASMGGMPVRILATGDREGNSPVCQIVDPDGALDWVPLAELRIFDPEFLPPALETLQNAWGSIRK